MPYFHFPAGRPDGCCGVFEFRTQLLAFRNVRSSYCPSGQDAVLHVHTKATSSRESDKRRGQWNQRFLKPRRQVRRRLSATHKYRKC